MDSLVIQIASYTEQALNFTWLHLLIWTLIGVPAWFFLRMAKNVHPQYHYHGRLALIFALPAGIIFLGLLQAAESLFFPEAPAQTMKFVTITAPIEIGVTASEPSASIALAEYFYAMTAVLFFSGILYLMTRFLAQWIQISRLKRTLTFLPISQSFKLDTANQKLAAAHPRTIRLAFLDDEVVPVTFGFREPVILLPASLRHDSGKCNLAIRHELVHILYKDFITHAGVLVTQMLFWFHPLIHQLKKELVDFREMRCDSLVLSEDGVSRKKYASLLLELLPMPVVNKELSVNMAQETSNLKKRIQMIAQQNLSKPIPKKSSLAIFGAIILCTAIAMACTDMQTQDVFDNEELDLMTNVDVNGERGYHQILIFLGDEDQANRHMNALDQLIEQDPGHIISINVLNNEPAIEKYGERGSKGVIEINTSIFPEAYNAVLKTLGMESQDQSELWYEEPAPVRINVDQMPELIGGIEALQREIRYPEMARQAGIEGRVFVQFIVDQEGNVELPTIIRGIGGGADEEVLRVISQAKFKPAISEGRPVRVKYSLPVTFRLPEKERDESTQSESVNSLPDNLKDAINVIGYMPLD